MSRRVTLETEIKDKALAIAALKLADMNYREEGDSLRITSGACSNASIDLRTGVVTGDSDYRGHTNAGVGVLREYYSEAMIRHRAHLEGHNILSREVQQNGDIVLMAQMA